MTPMPIFELTEQLIGHLQAEVRRAHLEGDELGISAGLVVERDGREMLLPCHPADAGALAVRARQADHGPRQRARPRALQWPAPAEDATRSWLDQVRPADFVDP